MNLLFTFKSIGKKHPYLEQLAIDIDTPSTTTVKALLEKIVIQQVEAFNQRKSENNLLRFLSENKINDLAASGRVEFNAQYNTKTADKNKAVKTVLTAFEDGLIAFFINENQQENSSTTITLNQSDTITFIRLTFLVGTIW